MSFNRKLVGENPRLMSSYCESCHICVAVSTHEGLLKESERNHLCPNTEAVGSAADPVPHRKAA